MFIRILGGVSAWQGLLNFDLVKVYLPKGDVLYRIISCYGTWEACTVCYSFCPKGEQMVIRSELLNYSILLLFCPYILNNYFIVTVSQIAVNNQLCLIETLNGNNYET